MLSALFLQVTFFYGLLAYAQSSFELGYIPLSIKTPYLNAWIVSNSGSSPEQAWPNFYTLDREFGWAGLIRVDNLPYQWMGNSGFNFTKTLSSYITPTKSVFTMQAGPMLFNVTFFSPIEPNDPVRQSMPFTYMYMDGFAANDSQPHLVQVYSDISGQWVSREDQTVVEWDTIDTGNLTYHRVTRQTPLPMDDNDNFAEDGECYYAILDRANLTWRTGEDINNRGQFATNGTLLDTKDLNFRAIGPQNWPVFGFAVDLGTISPGIQPDPVVWALGFVRNPLVTYTTESSVQSRVGYYMSQYSTLDAAIAAFLSDFQAAQQRSTDLDNKITNDANGISPTYAGILTLATRSIFSAMDITLPASSGGRSNSSDVRIFMKDMGMSTRANPVDVIYGALPALLYFNASLAYGLLEPLLEFQSGSNYHNPYASPDLGGSYPVVTGNVSNTEYLAVESTGSMLVMAYAHALKSGDGSLISRYYSTLSQWADYLVANVMSPPPGTMSCDDLTTPNLSNLALKGILGIYYMAKINEALSISNTTYMESATELFEQWQGLAITNNRIQTQYGQPTSSGMIYNLFPAVWLNSSLVSQDIISNQAQSYVGQGSHVLDSSLPDVVFPHWTLLTAATVPSNLSIIRNTLINSEYSHIYNVTNKSPLPMNYKASDGSRVSGSASAIWGAAFGILALDLPNVAIQVPSTRADNDTQLSSNKPNVGAIVGGTIGGLAILLLIAFTTFFIWRKRKQEQKIQQDIDAEHSKPHPFSDLLPTVNTTYQLHNNEMNQNLLDGAFRNSAGSSSSDVVPDSNTPSSPPPGLAAPPPPMASKRREAMNQDRIPRRYHRAAVPSESAGSTLSNPYSSSASEAEDLRAEVQQLRREMESIRHITEPPPGYQ